MWGGPYTVFPKGIPGGSMAAIPQVMTAVNTVDCDVMGLMIANSTAGDLTVTVEDTQASPQALYTNVTIPANSTSLLIDDAAGVTFKGGLQWQASGPGLIGSIKGRQLLGLVQGAATAQSNNLPIPV